MSQEIRLSLDGMHCQSCAALIQDELLDAPGVESAFVGFNENLAVVRVDPERAGPNPAEQLRERIEKLGYHAALA
jgi:Cu+-exporting ATPase